MVHSFNNNPIGVHSSLMDPAELQMSRGDVLVCVVTWECGWGRESRAAARKPGNDTALSTPPRPNEGEVHSSCRASGGWVGETDGEDTFIHLNLIVYSSLRKRQRQAARHGSGQWALAILGGFWRQYE